MKKIIFAKFNSNCAETGCKIKKGEKMVYDYDNKKCYAIASNTAIAFINTPVHDSAGAAIQAEQEAYFDNFWYNNY